MVREISKSNTSFHNFLFIWWCPLVLATGEWWVVTKCPDWRAIWAAACYSWAISFTTLLLIFFFVCVKWEIVFKRLLWGVKKIVSGRALHMCRVFLWRLGECWFLSFSVEYITFRSPCQIVGLLHPLPPMMRWHWII